MALGFTLDAPDYLTRARAGLPLMEGDAAPQPAAVPAAMGAAPAPPPAPSYSKPGFWDIAQGVLFNGESPAEAAMSARQRQYQLATMNVMAQTLHDASPDQRLAMLLNPAKLGEAVASRFQATNLKGGETRHFGEGGPASVTAPLLGFDPLSGKGWSVGSGGVTATGGAQLPGNFEAKDGIISSKRTGDVARTYSLPVSLPADTTGVPFTPSLGGAATGAGSGGAPAAPNGGDAPGGGSAAPRGIRNLNFGNLKALPSGHRWDGQTGVDAEGYAVFGSPADGVKAARQNLASYAGQGIDTLSALTKKWAPASDRNDPTAYAHYLSGRLQVGTNDKIDLADPATQAKVLRGIFDFENGPQAMSSWRGASANGGRPTAQRGDGFGQPFARGKQAQIVPGDDAVYSRFPAGTVLQRAPSGEISVVQKPEYSPEAKTAIRDHILSSDEYKLSQASSAAYKAMLGNAATMTGPSAYAMLDTFARAINPGAVARQSVIDTIEKHLGLPAQLVGGLESKFGQGNLPPQVRQQIINAVVPFAQAHWDQANRLNAANTALAKAHNFDSSDVTAPLEPRPEHVGVTVPPPAQRQTGLYVTPKGVMHWTGRGWLPAN
jgi:hypothetical protein